MELQEPGSYCPIQRVPRSQAIRARSLPWLVATWDDPLVGLWQGRSWVGVAWLARVLGGRGLCCPVTARLAVLPSLTCRPIPLCLPVLLPQRELSVR